jgi:hypothetical protein
MVMKMLEAGGLQVLTDGIRMADASNPNGYYELEQVKRLDSTTDAAWLTDARGKAVKIVSFLLTYVPERYDYRVVFMERDLDEIVASQNAMLAAQGEPHGVDDDRMRANYVQHLEQVKRFLYKRPSFSTLFVNYADVVASPREQAVRINAFLGGGLEVEVMAAVVEPTLYRTRRLQLARDGNWHGH